MLPFSNGLILKLIMTTDIDINVQCCLQQKWKKIGSLEANTIFTNHTYNEWICTLQFIYFYFLQCMTNRQNLPEVNWTVNTSIELWPPWRLSVGCLFHFVGTGSGNAWNRFHQVPVLSVCTDHNALRSASGLMKQNVWKFRSQS